MLLTQAKNGKPRKAGRHLNDGPRELRRRLALVLLMFALPLLLLLALRHLSVLGAYGSTAGADAGDRVADEPGDGSAVVDDASGAHGSRLGLGPGTSNGARGPRSTVAGGLLDAHADSALDDPIFDQWVMLQPFRQGGPQTIEGGSNTEDSGAANGDGLPWLLGRTFGDVPGGGAGFGPGGGDGGIAGGGSFGGGFGPGGVGGGPENGGGLPSGNVILNADSDQGSNGADGRNGEEEGHGPDHGNAPGGPDSPGGSDDHPGNGGNGGGGNAGRGNGGGNGGGFRFVPGRDVTGNPDGSDVSIILTDTLPNPTGGSNEGGDGSSDLTPQGPASAPVPEPTGLVLLGSGLVLAGRALRRRSTRG